MAFKRKAINFNLSCPHQRELYQYCTTQSANFSGFVKTVLFHFMKGQQIEPQTTVIPEVEQEHVDLARTFL